MNALDLLNAMKSAGLPAQDARVGSVEDKKKWVVVYTRELTRQEADLAASTISALDPSKITEPKSDLAVLCAYLISQGFDLPDQLKTLAKE